jgi:tRNA pseudouridine65 synthase
VLILYRDEHLVAVYKPAGLLVHRSRIERGERACALQLARDALGRRVFPVHRLDRPTAGLLLLALEVESARAMTRAFAAGRVRKTYLAVVRGWAAPAGRIEHPLIEELDPMTDALARPDKAARAATTSYGRLATAELPCAVGRYPSARYSLLGVTPHTGRRHQIRRHLKHIFHPVIGDTTHGDGCHNRFFREHLGCSRLLLCAVSLAFDHPRSGLPVRIEAAPDAELGQVLQALGWPDAGRGGVAGTGPALGPDPEGCGAGEPVR